MASISFTPDLNRGEEFILSTFFITVLRQFPMSRVFVNTSPQYATINTFSLGC